MILNKRSDSEQPSPSNHSNSTSGPSLAEGYLSSSAAKVCNNISSKLGGESWKVFQFPNFGHFSFRSHNGLGDLEAAVDAALEHPASNEKKRDGSLPLILCQAVLRANYLRKKATREKTNPTSHRIKLDSLPPVDFRRATELLRSHACEFAFL